MQTRVQTHTHMDTHTLSLVQPGETNRSISATCTSQELTITVGAWGEDDIWKDFSRFQHRWAFSLSPSKISTRYSSLYNQIPSSFCSAFFYTTALLPPCEIWPRGAFTRLLTLVSDTCKTFVISVLHCLKLHHMADCSVTY